MAKKKTSKQLRDSETMERMDDYDLYEQYPGYVSDKV